MKIIFRRADDVNICYGKEFLILPRKLNGKWCWMHTVWRKATFIEFNMIEGNQWDYSYLTDDEMMQERLMYDLNNEVIIPPAFDH